MNLKTIVKRRVPARYVAHLHFLRIATYYAAAERECRSIWVDGFGKKEETERKRVPTSIWERTRENDRSRGCGARARDRKAGGKTAHAPSSSTWRITCCPLLKPPCLHLPLLLLLRVPILVLSDLSLYHLRFCPTLRAFSSCEPSRLSLPGWRAILSSWCNALSHITFNYNALHLHRNAYN